VLNSERAIEVNIYIMRSFLKLREMIAALQNTFINIDHSDHWMR